MLIKHGTPVESKVVEKEQAPDWTKNFKKLEEDSKADSEEKAKETKAEDEE